MSTVWTNSPAPVLVTWPPQPCAACRRMAALGVVLMDEAPGRTRFVCCACAP